MYSRLDSPIIALLSVAVTTMMAGCYRTEAIPTASRVPVPRTATWNDKIDDAIISWRVQSALQGAQDLQGLALTLETRKSIVTLGGVVDHQVQADRAILVVSKVAGVNGVESKITNKEGVRMASNIAGGDLIVAKVNAALRSDPVSKGIDIVAVNSRGEVKLGGLVDNQAQVEHAIKLIRTVEGVERVVSDVSIKK